VLAVSARSPLADGRALLGGTSLLMSGCYVGYLVGSSLVPRLLGRVGHIRVFAALASTAAAALPGHLLWVHPVPWTVLRFVTGSASPGSSSSSRAG
jgi:hypothetical protein